MAKRPGEQTNQTINREIKPNAGCDIPGRQYAQNDEYSGGYQDVEFEQFNQLLPQNPEYFHREATPGDGQFRGPNSVSDESLAKQIASMEIRDAASSSNQRSVYFANVGLAERGTDDGMGPESRPSPDRTDDTLTDFRRGKR